MRTRWGHRSLRVRFGVLCAGLSVATAVVLLAVMSWWNLGGGRGRLEILGEAPPAAGAQPSPPDDELAELIEERADDLVERRLLTSGLAALAMVAIGGSVVGWWLSGRLVRPLRLLRDDVRSLTADADLRSLPLADGAPVDEVGDLSRALTEMLSKISDARDRERRFAAHAAHELRAPLALARAVVEAAADATDDELRDAVPKLLALNDRSARLIDGMLRLSRSERDVDQRHFVDLADLVDDVLADVDASAPRHPCIDCRAESSPTLGDPALLRELVRNLVENAIIHNVPGGRIWIECGVDGGWATLRVSNTGDELDALVTSELFEPFVRRGASGERTGVGLGLAIVRATAEAHGGTVDATPRPTGGLTVTVRLRQAGGPPSNAEW